MQILNPCSLYNNSVVIRRPEFRHFFKFIGRPFMKTYQSFYLYEEFRHKSWSVMQYLPFITALVQKNTPCQGVFWSKCWVRGIWTVTLIVVLFLLPGCVFLYQSSFSKIKILHYLYCSQTLSCNMSWTTAPILIIFADPECLQSVQHICSD